MKKLITTCAFIALGSVAAFAQAAKTNAAANQTNAAVLSNDAAAEKAATKNAKEYQKQLSLKDQQYQAIYQAEYDYARQNKINMEQGIKPTDGASQQLGMMRDQRIQNALTPDQFAKYKQISAKATSAPARTN